ncbi:MAG TPA: glycoside hydrolase family 15 protein [Candidatus Dormibacteraeota bacterium]|nr:glycoside hydrolase family 15 protein [Candidatus Dormibacteraeota bacterium]
MAAVRTAGAPATTGGARVRYPLIADHGLIGDLQTAALVANDGTVDWFCCPRFDSPSVFASLLDHERGGHFQIAPERADCTRRQLYFPDSAVLITRFMTEEGVGEVVDFMPIEQPETPTDRHLLVRVVRVVRGTMRFRLECAPRFDYGRAPHEMQLTDGGAVFRSSNLQLTLHSVTPLERRGQDALADIVLRQGEVAGIVLESGPGVAPRTLSRGELVGTLIDTVGYWKAWLRRSTYAGRWREVVQRSAMTLRLMTYAPTGAPVAAPTAGLPEQVGGERNWDYRFTWIRDASFSVYALLGLGYTNEAAAFMHWLGDRVAEQAGADSGPLKIMYRVDGGSDLREEVLEHLEGYRGSSPVRIGNGAADQLQLDIYGEALDSFFQAHQRGLRIAHQGWLRLNGVMSWLGSNWDRTDEGIWETRGGQKHFTYGRLMSWVAMDRMVRIARDLGFPTDLDRLVTERDRIYRQIVEKGWNAGKEAYVQHYDGDVLDASVLMMPMLGFVSPTDPMWQSTLRAVDRELVSDSLVYRYDPSASPDGLRGHEGTFSICTFWYVDALARSGRLEEARLVFEKMLTYANDLGLFSEEIGPTGEQLGNFPQAFSHLALINAAINLNHELDHAPGTAGFLRAASDGGRGIGASPRG